VSAEIADGVGSAYAPTEIIEQIANAGAAIGVGEAYGATAEIQTAAGTGTGTGAAFDAVTAVAAGAGAYSGVGSGVYGRVDNAAILAALNAQQIGRRKEAEAVYLAAVAHNAEVMRERRAAAEARRQREEEWLLGLISTEQMLEATWT
jgi:hypothetical protein